MRSRRLAALALLVVLPLLAGCTTIGQLRDRISLETFGEDFDNLCVAGKLKADAAEWLNANPAAWKAHRDYTDPRQPVPLKAGDRLFNGDCSAVAKRIGNRDLEGAFEALGEVARGGE